MARYIDADKLMERLNKKKAGAANQRYTEGFNDALMKFRSMVHSADTVELAEVKHGEWIAHYNGSQKPIYRCSVCNERLIGYSDPNKVPYCHCGAKMDGGKAE